MWQVAHTFLGEDALRMAVHDMRGMLYSRIYLRALDCEDLSPAEIENSAWQC